MARNLGIPLLLAVHTLAKRSGPEVVTSGGTVWGTALPASAGSEPVSQFLGLPFATAAKWEAPHDATGSYQHDPLNATMWGSACTQVLSDGVSYGTFDCLKVNVWTPASSSSSTAEQLSPSRPVLVFIYGGSNLFGEAEPYNLSAIAAFHDTVAVNFNYRTGPYGWMSFAEDVQDGKSTGNFGILDIQSALRWVQREIGAFGGDPTRVAIHGQSSGGGLVELQYVAPHSSGLFHAAISESGGLSATSLADALNNTATCAAAVGCLGDDGRTVSKACMRAVHASNITDLTYVGRWSPTVDGVTIPQDPQLMLAEGIVNEASVILGAQTNDSFLFISRDWTRDSNVSQPNNMTDGDLIAMNVTTYREQVEYEVGGSSYSHFFSEALRLYPPVMEPVAGSFHNVQNVGRMESDQMGCSLRRRAALLNKAHPGAAFTYRFNYWYQSNDKCVAVPNFHLEYLGSVHQDEVTFVLGQPNFMEAGSCCGKWGLSEGAESCAREAKCTSCYNESFGTGYAAYFNEKEFAFAKQVGRYWTNFAASGDPNKRNGDVTVKVLQQAASSNQWPSSSDGAIVLDADEPGGSTVEKELLGNAELCKLWDAIAIATEEDQKG